VTIVLSLSLLIGHFFRWSWSFSNAFGPDGAKPTKNPMLMMWFVVGIGFVSFLYARYSIALAKMAHWRLLRSGATLMAGTSLACLALAIALAAGTALEWKWAEPLFAYMLRIVLIVLGVEFAANFIFDFYRPRTPGVLPKPSFDSRLLGLVGEPGGIAKSIADAINYQFGFEVSSTWFYQLLQRWLFPIMVFTFGVVLMLSSIVIVDADEQVVVERFGQLRSEGEVLGPGIHLKWPYPVDVVRRAPVKRVRELVIGESTQEDDDDPHKAVLWTEAHDYVPEMMLLVASPRRDDLSDARLPAAQAADAKSESRSVPVSLVMISVPIEYRVRDVKKYLYRYAEPEKLMEAVAYQFLSDYGAGVDLDELMGPGRDALNRELKAALQQRLDEYDTGIEIVFSGIRGAHPPAQDGVADAFLRVITAQTQKGATINAAQGEARKILTKVAGTETRAEALDEAIRERDRLQSGPKSDPEQFAAAQRLVNDLLMGNAEKGIPPLSGEAAAMIARARAKASQLVAEAATKVSAFKTDLVAYRTAPQLYQERKWMGIWSGLESVRKYLIVGDPANVVIEYETEQAGGLDQVLLDDKK
jgi:regulator of protease activity HflC (stomatin/prohibitin superfamily)